MGIVALVLAYLPGHAPGAPTRASVTLTTIGASVSASRAVAPVTTTTVPSSTPEQAWVNSGPVRCIRRAESGDAAHPAGDYQRTDGPEPDGAAYQFNLKTWMGIGGRGLPSSAAPAEQDYRAYLLWLKYGFSQWQTAPGCGV